MTILDIVMIYYSPNYVTEELFAEDALSLKIPHTNEYHCGGISNNSNYINRLSPNFLLQKQALIFHHL